MTNLEALLDSEFSESLDSEDDDDPDIDCISDQIMEHPLIDLE
jgi:hypothetical protein